MWNEAIKLKKQLEFMCQIIELEVSIEICLRFLAYPNELKHAKYLWYQQCEIKRNYKTKNEIIKEGVFNNVSKIENYVEHLLLKNKEEYK